LENLKKYAILNQLQQ